MKHKFNDLFKSYTYPSLNKAIPNSKFNVSDECNINTLNKNKLEKFCSKINKLELLKSNHSKTMISKRSKISYTKNNNGHNVNKNTNKYLGLVGNVGNMLAHVTMMPTMSPGIEPMSPCHQCYHWIHGWVTCWLMCYHMTA